ncbi:MAG TPA: YcnI family protein [Actinoallomurus sp.]|nr:YcnI family protein [Actinoallomurus sp.]
MSFPHAAKSVLTGGGVVAAAIVALALPAAAHVTVSPDTAEPGGYGAFNVRVPNEEADADTTKVQLHLPTDHPIASVSVQPTPGWKIEVTKGKLPQPIKTDDGEVTEGVTDITWSGGKITPGQFQQFAISLGPLPTDTPRLYFKTLQTYTDKSGKESVVRWIELPSGGQEPEHPAPSITLTKAAGPQAAPAARSDDDDGGTGTTLGVLGLVAGLLGLVAGVTALIRSGRSSSA